MTFWNRILFVFVFGCFSQNEYYSYSYSGNFFKPNIIRIRIRVIFSNRIVFVFVFAGNFFPNTIYILNIFYEPLVLGWGYSVCVCMWIGGTTTVVVCVWGVLLRLVICYRPQKEWYCLFVFSPLCSKCLLKLPAWWYANWHGLHLFCFSPLCIFKCALKWLAWEEAYSHWLHLFDFSPLWISICFLKSPAREDA